MYLSVNKIHNRIYMQILSIIAIVVEQHISLMYQETECIDYMNKKKIPIKDIKVNMKNKNKSEK